MRRRDFLAMGLTMAGMFAARRVLAPERGSRMRAAVVIGVDKAGNLPVLKGAASGAHTVADWLRSEGFEVFPFIDDHGLVKAGEIFDAIEALVSRGTLDQLVIYSPDTVS
jgi:hypothetical protein